MGKITASSIQHISHLTVFDEIFEERLNALALDQTIVLLIDNVDESALYWLFSQFDMLGFRGWSAISTTEQKRDLLKNAIALKKLAGTPFGLKEALRLIGFPNTEIIEGSNDSLYDGAADYDGSITYGGNYWATIRLVLDIGDEFGINDDLTEKLVRFIEQWKRACVYLAGFRWKATMTERSRPSDEGLAMLITTAPAEDMLGQKSYNGSYSYDGILNYSVPEIDPFEETIT